MDILMLLLTILSFAAIIGCAAFFIHNIRRYKYIGNSYIYVVIMFTFCLCFSLYINLHLPHNSYIAPIAASLFESFKMAVMNFEKSKIDAYFSSDILSKVFGCAYILTSLVTFAFVSISIVLAFIKTFGIGIGQWFRRHNKKQETIHFIFTDPKVSISVKLAEELNNSKTNNGCKNAVSIFLTSSSLKTQEGSEFKNMLISKGIHVRNEDFSEKLCKKIFGKYFDRQFKKCERRKKQVKIFCMFSSDEASTQMANYFYEAISTNENFIKIKNQIDNESKIENEQNKHLRDTNYDLVNISPLSSFQVFITYQDADIDIIHNYSKDTLHIINTLSQYDMISCEFLLDNPITNFIDLKEINSSDNQTMHVTFLGLGVINRPIFDKMTYSYQLWDDNINKIHYHILDKKADELVNSCSNEFTQPPQGYRPFLYSVDGACDGENLYDYQVLDNYIKGLLKDEKQTRFNPSGFELFIVSLQNTNADLMVAYNLRRAIQKYISVDRLKKTYIFVRIGEPYIADKLQQAKIINRTIDLNADGKQLPQIICYGNNALMPQFIENHYNKIINYGILADYAYELTQLEQDQLAKKEELYKKVKVRWLTKTKREVLENTPIAFSLKTKEALFKGIEKSDLFKQFEDADYQNIDLEKNLILKLATLEHNRWLATKWINDKCTALDMNEYIEKKKTKNVSKTCHVCMVSNAGLRKIYDECTKNGKEDIDALNLVFKNDITLMQRFYENEK